MCAESKMLHDQLYEDPSHQEATNPGDLAYNSDCALPAAEGENQ